MSFFWLELSQLPNYQIIQLPDIQLPNACPVRNLKALIDDRKRFTHVRFGDAQRRIGEERVPTHERIESVFAEEPPQGGHLVRRAVERRQRLPRGAVSNELDEPE